MSKNILKATVILGTLAAASAGIAAMLSDEQNRKKVRSTADDLSKKANAFVRELEEDYQELDENLNKYSKSKEYKQRVDDVSKASKEILKQLDILKENSTELLKAFKKAAQKSID